MVPAPVTLLLKEIVAALPEYTGFGDTVAAGEVTPGNTVTVAVVTDPGQVLLALTVVAVLEP
jgi:hypothetical protein